MCLSDESESDIGEVHSQPNYDEFIQKIADFDQKSGKVCKL